MLYSGHYWRFTATCAAALGLPNLNYTYNMAKKCQNHSYILILKVYIIYSSQLLESFLVILVSLKHKGTI